MTNNRHFKNYIFLILSFFLFICITDVKAASTIENSPDVVAKDFYTWYLKELSQDHFKELEPTKLSKYVAKGLIKEIEIKENSADGIDEDYFTKAQDYLDEWVTNIAVSDTKIQKNTASAKVTLGVSDISQLSLSFIKEKNEWKIRKVRKIR